MTVQKQLAQSQDLVCQELREELYGLVLLATSLQNKSTNKGVVPITLKELEQESLPSLLHQHKSLIRATQEPITNFTKTIHTPVFHTTSYTEQA